eukprot:TRINITY_DN7955_c1_g1_i1.p1 TRINITY_DN7955_c1_g1~~TRINITY_DN7955_c1_g1_i1.p1  ORF type:complete len:497 (+),score=81.75 TRINITY_DN7955_c1_g1_i1:87-1577(+)
MDGTAVQQQQQRSTPSQRRPAVSGGGKLHHYTDALRRWWPSSPDGSRRRTPHQRSAEELEAEAALERRLALALSSEYSPAQALYTFWRSFTTVYAIRQGITMAMRIFELGTKRGASAIFSFDNLVNHKKNVNVESLRLALSIGGFTGGYKLLHWALARVLGQENKYVPGLSGFLAGFSLLFQERGVRRIIALYLFTRLLQCGYNELKKRKYFDFWWTGNWSDDGSNIGDSLLFILTSAQVMYAYALRPDTLPSSYYKFILKTGPISEVILTALRKNVRGAPVDVKAVNEFIIKRAGNQAHTLLETALPPIISCGMLHPQNPSCTLHNMDTFWNAARRTLPVYATLTFVPLIVLRFARLLRDPVRLLTLGTLSCLRSTVFLATLCTTYQLVVCLQRKMVTHDHKSIYYIAGIVSGFAILIEKKSRRSELALYVFPRALDSLYTQLLDRKWMASVPHFELLLFCVSMGGLMHFYQNAAYTMAPTLRYILAWLFAPKQQ